MGIPFLDTELPELFRFSTALPFSDSDKMQFPWLAEDVRYYRVEGPELGKGGRAIAYRGFVCDRAGEILPGTPQVVIKLPNLNMIEYTFDQIRDYLRRLSDEGVREWQLTRRRLEGCDYANPIFDFQRNDIRYLNELIVVPITVQLFLHNASSLDEYLMRAHQRTEKYQTDRVPAYDNWNGMSNPQKWIELTRSIATGLADIHQRRVVHGDIWPPNVFIQQNGGKPSPIFIDFGEAFPIEPKGDPQSQRDHAYRAPERRDDEAIVTNRADIYSLGKLLLYLATGEESKLPPDLRGHERRELVREKFERRNPGFVDHNLFIVDIICKCLSLDPVERPTITDILQALNSYGDTLAQLTTSTVSVSARLNSLDAAWHQTNAELTGRKAHVPPFLELLVDQKIRDVEMMVAGLSNGVVDMTDTRERLMLALIGLFGQLGPGDRYLSITNPRMWQASALGLDGRYFTAAQLAVKRGASVQRAFIVSIQELGPQWVHALCEKLKALDARGQYPAAARLASALLTEVGKYQGALQQGKVAPLPGNLRADAQKRLTLLLKSYLTAKNSVCKGAFDQGVEFISSLACKGMYLGIIPVATLGAMRTLKAAHPVSVFHYSAAEPSDQYLLMMIDCIGRNSYPGADGSVMDDESFQRSAPELRGITVFKSVLGIPEDRIKMLELQFKRSIPVGSWIETLHSALPEPSDAAD
jgi:serine/threonine protein kinase